MKTYNTREIKKLLKANGWECVRTNGDHFTYAHPQHSDIVTVNNRINKMVATRLIKTYNLV